MDAPGSVFCLLRGVSSGCARSITGQVTSVTWPVIGWAQSELTPSKRQKTGPGQCLKLCWLHTHMFPVVYGLIIIECHEFHMWQHNVVSKNLTRCSENDNTLGWPRSENANIGWMWPFQIMMHFMVHCNMPPNFRPQCDFLTFPNMSHHPSDFVQIYHGKFQSSVKCAKIGQA